jgi:uncharacterized protein YecE (DUF72 family)
MKTRRGRIRIGCSGWIYEHWRGRFYPEYSSPQEWFGIYSEVFDTVEINNTFYRLPSPSVFKKWRLQAPSGFCYAVKVSRYLTHMKKLKDAREPLKRFVDRARLLEDHLGPLLYQLPPRWRVNLPRLESFLELLPEDLVHVFEFREQSWLTEEVLRLLANRNVCYCIHDMPGVAMGRPVTATAVYLRFHGAERRYQGGYQKAALNDWWSWIDTQVAGGRDVYVYFNNDAEAHAVNDALQLKKLAGFNVSHEIAGYLQGKQGEGKTQTRSSGEPIRASRRIDRRLRMHSSLF